MVNGENLMFFQTELEGGANGDQNSRDKFIKNI